MAQRVNAFGQPIGEEVPGWNARPAPSAATLAGRTCRLERLDPARHAADLFAANARDPEGRNMTYLFTERAASLEEYRRWVEEVAPRDDPFFYAIVDGASGKAVGVAAYMRIDRANGVIEIGHLNFSPLLQRTTAATEAIYLLLANAFDHLGYRRCEWKCDSLNAPSRAAAERFGFRFEGIFRQAIVYKGRNRDTAWFSIIDSEWPALRAAFERWLAPQNFDAKGQKRGLREFIAAARADGAQR
jgi:RimJ/RimL family protein N-acetyltransferase